MGDKRPACLGDFNPLCFYCVNRCSYQELCKCGGSDSVFLGELLKDCERKEV